MDREDIHSISSEMELLQASSCEASPPSLQPCHPSAKAGTSCPPCSPPARCPSCRPPTRPHCPPPWPPSRWWCLSTLFQFYLQHLQHAWHAWHAYGPPCLISICAQVSTMASSTSLSSMLPLPLVPPISSYLISIIPRLHQTLSSYLISIIPQLHTTRPYFHCFTTQLQVLPIASSTLLASNTNCHQCNNLWSKWHYLLIYDYLSLFIESHKREQQKKCLKVKVFKFEITCGVSSIDWLIWLSS